MRRPTTSGIGTDCRLPAKTSLLMKRNALCLKYKRRPLVEKDRDILGRTTVVTTNVHYAVKRIRRNAVARIVTA
ncbi:hypothetical protein GCM10025786_21460 [Nocardioides caeni]|uniref:hypothetical protein n=2 Tax=Nocardioides caeni TaxID=574700 RepID=UPI0026C8814E